MESLIDFFTGWGGFFTLTFHGKTVLMIVSGCGFAAVAVVALRARVSRVARLLVLIGATVIFGAILGSALGIFG